jgi:hypothetical protein
MLPQTWYFGDWSCKHEQFAKFMPRYATETILIGIRVVAKSAGSESPDFTSIEALLCGP